MWGSGGECCCLRTFLAFVEDWRARVVDAWRVVLVFVDFAAALVDALLGHGWWG